MKAECFVRLNDATAAKPLVDAIRLRAGLNELAATPTLEDIYNERAFELNWEGHWVIIDGHCLMTGRYVRP